jgi:NAD(P)-dependent dehydrogenase (short-subunit alcohol dehydrogenase family)
MRQKLELQSETFRAVSYPNYVAYFVPFSYSYGFVKCDVRRWEDQVAVFKSAVANSPHKNVDIVIANAGILREDSLSELGMITHLFLLLSLLNTSNLTGLKMTEMNLPNLT